MYSFHYHPPFHPTEGFTKDRVFLRPISQQQITWIRRRISQKSVFYCARSPSSKSRGELFQLSHKQCTLHREKCFRTSQDEVETTSPAFNRRVHPCRVSVDNISVACVLHNIYIDSGDVNEDKNAAV